jgi:hypothetical protein
MHLFLIVSAFLSTVSHGSRLIDLMGVLEAFIEGVFEEDRNVSYGPCEFEISSFVSFFFEPDTESLLAQSRSQLMGCSNDQLLELSESTARGIILRCEGDSVLQMIEYSDIVDEIAVLDETEARMRHLISVCLVELATNHRMTVDNDFPGIDQQKYERFMIQLLRILRPMSEHPTLSDREVGGIAEELTIALDAMLTDMPLSWADKITQRVVALFVDNFREKHDILRSKLESLSAQMDVINVVKQLLSLIVLSEHTHILEIMDPK